RLPILATRQRLPPVPSGRWSEHRKRFYSVRRNHAPDRASQVSRDLECPAVSRPRLVAVPLGPVAAGRTRSRHGNGGIRISVPTIAGKRLDHTIRWAAIRQAGTTGVDTSTTKTRGQE